MFFQGRGNLYLAVRDADGVPGIFNRVICTDSLSLDLATDSFEHTNKCGPVDVVDYRGAKSQSGTLSLSFADMADYNFALGVLGTVTATGSPGTVTNEELPAAAAIGDVYFLGGGVRNRHRAITGLTIDGMAVNTDFTLDAPSGKVTFLTAYSGSPAPTADYGYTDGASVSLFTAPTQEYFAVYEYINKADANNPGSLELYRVRFDPAQNLDMQSDELQIMQLTGSVLADLTLDVTDLEFGQFGRRVS